MLHKMMMKCLFQVMNRQIHLNAAILRFSSRFGGLVYFGQTHIKSISIFTITKFTHE
ncbi:hypothetical protein [Chryseobacterium gleum]|uniref:hypothetical protein n=1 Tax=Chryseobacterium gleum TaxID=250 RepID=UPI0028AC6B06|nr:hypothetical protein [Chryseobacterium gleum]